MASGKYEGLSQLLLNFLFNGGTFTQPSNVYISLFSVTPSVSSTGTEATGSAYARITSTANTTNWPTISGSTTTITNNVAQTASILGTRAVSLAAGGSADLLLATALERPLQANVQGHGVITPSLAKALQIFVTARGLATVTASMLRGVGLAIACFGEARVLLTLSVLGKPGPMRLTAVDLAIVVFVLAAEAPVAVTTSDEAVVTFTSSDGPPT